MNLDAMSRELDTMVETVHTAFLEQGWTLFDGSPDRQRIRKIILNLAQRLCDDPTPTCTATARIMVMRGEEHEPFGVYLYLGDL